MTAIVSNAFRGSWATTFRNSRGLGGEQTTGIRINVFESFLQMHGGRTIEFVQYFVMRSLGQSHVEIDIGRDTVVQSSGCGGRTAPGEVCPDLFDIRLRTSLRGPFDNGDLQNPPDLLQIADVGTLHAPLHRLVPCRPAFDERPGPLLHFQQPHVGQDLHGFAHRRTADPENFHQFGFGRQLPAYLEPSLRDLLLQPDGHLFGQRSFSNRRIRTLYHHII